MYYPTTLSAASLLALALSAITTTASPTGLPPSTSINPLTNILSTRQDSSSSINCSGSINCLLKSAIIPDLRDLLASFPNQSAPALDGQQLACAEKGFLVTYDFCAFFQGRDGTIGEAVELLQDLADIGCKNCGSAPATGLVDAGDDEAGILTVNFVSQGCGLGDIRTNSALKASISGVCAGIGQ